MSRLDDLQGLRATLLDRMQGEGVTDQNFTMMGRLLLDTLKQIEELSGGETAGKESGLSDFEKRLRERESGAASTCRAKA